VSLTEQELPNALEHVTYEWWMLWEVAIWLRDRDELPGAEWNAHVESAAIHLRNLSQFLAKSGDDRDIRPGDFGVTWSCSTETEGKLIETFDRASKLVAHPSRERLNPDRGWKLADLVPMVDAEMQRWFALVDHVPWTRDTEANVQGVAVRRAEWNRRRRRNFTGATGPATWSPPTSGTVLGG
jgi:hypothetical protein